MEWVVSSTVVPRARLHSQEGTHAAHVASKQRARCQRGAHAGEQASSPALVVATAKKRMLDRATSLLHPHLERMTSHVKRRP